jgi:flagellar FliL protein
MAEDVNDTDFKDEKNEASSKNPLLTILILLNLIVLGGVGYFQWVNFQKLSQQPSIHDVVKAEMKKVLQDEEEGGANTGQAIEEDGILFPLDGFTANLAQGDGPRRYLRLRSVLKFSKGSSEEEFKARKPQIRDTIISIINSKRPEDLLKLEGKNFLKEEIKAAINSFLVDGNVIDVYYVSFQIN